MYNFGVITVLVIEPGDQPDLFLNNLTVPSGKNDTRTFLNYIACDQWGWRLGGKGTNSSCLGRRWNCATERNTNLSCSFGNKKSWFINHKHNWATREYT
ncbi:hypothetical protein OSB04_002969 [Centaurea solstitialis]|uniref:Uncharacterized protein n=1 Tax=Centaurea solstitialis TaxID=347529 RepID=A0AA38U1H7_9ASTR|nr:hypothetical protein OSB04_002969 [Centaurea solstitialis]